MRQWDDFDTKMCIYIVCGTLIFIFGCICSIIEDKMPTITTSHPKDGYVCFLATTSDSVALSCIKE